MTKSGLTATTASEYSGGFVAGAGVNCYKTITRTCCGTPIDAAVSRPWVALMAAGRNAFRLTPPRIQVMVMFEARNKQRLSTPTSVTTVTLFDPLFPGSVRTVVDICFF